MARSTVRLHQPVQEAIAPLLVLSAIAQKNGWLCQLAAIEKVILAVKVDVF